MMRTDSLDAKKIRYNLGIRAEKGIMIIMLMGFFLGRASILNKLTPFGVAFLAAYIIMKDLNIHLLLSTMLGTLVVQGGNGIGYLLGYISIYIFFASFKSERSYSLLKASIASAVIFTCCRAISVLLGRTIFMYDLFMVLFEGIMVFTMTYIFSFSLPIERSSSTLLNNEKMICSFITLALALSGIKEMAILGVGIKNLVSILMVLYLSYGYGGIFGGTTGIILGMVAYISKAEMPFIIGIFGIAGLLSGIFKDLGKMGSVLGFLLGNGIISFYINGLGTSFLNVREILVAALLFLISVDKVNEKIFKLFEMDLVNRKDQFHRKDEIAAKKIDRMAELLNSLSFTFKESAMDEESHSMGEVYGMVDGVANNICINCSRYKECWDDNYYNTYQSFFNMLGIIELKGMDSEEAYLEASKFCIKSRELIEILDRAVERLKLNHKWELKLKENRVLLSEQLDGVGKVLKNITEDIYTNPIFNKEVEENLYKDLKNARIDIKDVSVIQMGEEDFEVFIDLNTPVEAQHKLKSIVSKSLGFPVIGDTGFNDLSNIKQRFKLIRSNRFSAMTKIATMPNSENRISGDSFTFGEIENTHYSALSDGMGIGRKASEESKVAISLLERLMDANVDKNIILKTINSVLRVKSNEEMFATLDLSFIDLYLGKLQMIKTGAPATFIKRKDHVEIINSATLPVGILKDIDFNLYEEYIEDGDIIIMMSDGVLESSRSMNNPEAWMKDIIIDVNSINPQVMANEILKRAQMVAADDRDDMTVLVTKVWKNI